MKVIVAGYIKTGTKSMNAALTMLGYKVYDQIENVYILEKEWSKILKEGWTSEDFWRMYEDVDAVVDAPAFYFWGEIHKAFPDAKIILTIRENEDVWFESLKNQMEILEGDITFKLFSKIIPRNRNVYRNVIYPSLMIIHGWETPKHCWKFLNLPLNKELMKLKYRAHNAHVLQNAPRDKLLVYKCTDGWEPLCRFLDCPIPNEPFPWENAGGNILNTLRKNNPIAKKLQQDAYVGLSFEYIGIEVISVWITAIESALGRYNHR